MLQPVLLKMPKTFAGKNNSNDSKFNALEKALFYAQNQPFENSLGEESKIDNYIPFQIVKTQIIVKLQS